MKRTILALLAAAGCTCSMICPAQLVSADNGAVALDGNGLMWANTVGLNLTWNSAGAPGSAQAWIASLNASDYGGYSDWTLATGMLGTSPNTTSNQLGELFYVDCGNVAGQQTALNNASKDCSALSALNNALQTGTGGFAGDLNISSASSLGWVAGQPYEAWAIYQTPQSTQEYWDADTNNAGEVGTGDALAVRSVSVPAPGSAWLLLGGFAALAANSWWDKRTAGRRRASRAAA